MKLRLLVCLVAFAMVVPAIASGKDRKRRSKKKKKKADTAQVEPADTADTKAKDTPDDPNAAKAKGDAKIIKRGGKDGKGQEKLFDFTGLQLDGNTRMPQLLYFLDRANTELERASLERRSFIPEMVRSMDEEPL